MALATRCPHCQTAFKVANDQLKLHAGLVRCGSCQQTFNAVENLIPAEAPQPAPVPAKPTSTASAVALPAAATPAVTTSSIPGTPVMAAKPQVETAQPVSVQTASARPVTPAVVSEVRTEFTPEASPALEEIKAPAPEAPKPAIPAATVVPPAAPTTAPAAAAKPAVSPATPASEKPVIVARPASATAKPATEVLAAISKAELEFEAETFDMPRDVKVPHQPSPVSPASPPVKAVPPVAAQSAPATPSAVPKPGIAKGTPPKPETVPSTASALEFDMGDGGLLLPAEELHETDVARVELETRAALMDPPTADWSVSEVTEEQIKKVDKQSKKADQASAFAPTEILSPNSVTKVWRHKDHGELAEPGDAVSLNDAVDEDSHQKAYIDAAEVALAQQAAINEDSSSDIEVEQDKPNFVIQAEKQRARKRMANIMLGLMIVLLIPLLVGQSAYIFRNQLAVRLPDTRPWLQQACKYLSCQVALPAQIEKIIVDSNELQNLAPERNVFMLVMQIQNQSDVVQTWPNIELVLNDIKDKPLLQRAFTPADYLTEKDKLEKGFAAGGEQNIKLYFELPTLKAAGFHVGVFYP
ncbi:DUF3426 domain-containing protein [Undibacterium sp. Di27W]|uniref:DUF3426 domain-containing protein n=1 Tax=Undibacterium sp. Di27W TaxID=3413036 RepID=UPI003BF03868